jgi:hypothetical protein
MLSGSFGVAFAFVLAKDMTKLKRHSILAVCLGESLYKK